MLGLIAHTLAHRYEPDNGRDTDHDAEHRQRRAELVQQQTFDAQPQRLQILRADHALLATARRSATRSSTAKSAAARSAEATAAFLASPLHVRSEFLVLRLVDTPVAVGVHHAEHWLKTLRQLVDGNLSITVGVLFFESARTVIASATTAGDSATKAAAALTATTGASATWPALHITTGFSGATLAAASPATFTRAAIPRTATRTSGTTSRPST